MDPDFEKVAKAAISWMQSHGFPDAALTDDAGHGVYDIEATGAIAEVTVDAPPSRPNVQRLDTVSRNADRPALYFSLRGFTTSALEWANNVNIALFTLDKDSDELVTANPIAEELDIEPPPPEQRLLDAATRAVASVKEELDEERRMAGVDEQTRERIKAAREAKKMRRDLFG